MAPEDPFRKLFEANPQPMLVVDAETQKILAANEAAARLYGYSRAELLASTADSVFPLLTAGIAGPAESARIWPQRTRSGEMRTAEVKQVEVVFEDRPAVLMIAHDVGVGHRREMESKLRLTIGELVSKGANEATSGTLQVLAEWLGCDREPVVALDRYFKIIYWNQAAESLFGRPAQEAVGSEYLLGIGAALLPEEGVAIQVDAAQNCSWKGVINCIGSQGKQLVVEISLSVLPDQAGAVRGFFGIHRNVTDRRKRDDVLRVNERRKKHSHNGLGLGVWEMNLETGETRWSKELLKIYGIQADLKGLTLQQWGERIHPDDREAVMRALAPSSRPEMLDHQYRIVWPDGSVRWLHTKSTAVYDCHKQINKLIGVDFDITAVKRAEMSNREFAAIVEFTDLAIFSTDLVGHIVDWNSGAERIFGYSAEEIAGHPVHMLAPADFQHPLDEIVERVRGAQKTEHLESVCAAKNGERVQILLSAAPILDHSRTAVGGAYIMWDVTELKMLQRQLVQAQKLESIGQLAAGIAHEINTPIQYIGDNAKFLEEGFRDLFRLLDAGRGSIERLRAGASPDAAAEWDTVARQVDLEYLRVEAPAAIEQLLQGVNHVARIVRAMREFSHPSSIEMIMLDINRAIENTALVSKNEWKYVANLTTDLEAHLPTVPCVSGEFNQVILNLIVNAAHAIADVVSGTERKGSIHITTRRKGQFVEIRIIDTGSGIPEKIQSKVFDPFFTTKDVGKGTGQGLAIAYSVIVQKHHGTIRFETKEGEGTTFIVQLPVTQGVEER
jgi:PAS domain S-box-containing protein